MSSSIPHDHFKMKLYILRDSTTHEPTKSFCKCCTPYLKISAFSERKISRKINTMHVSNECYIVTSFTSLEIVSELWYIFFVCIKCVESLPSYTCKISHFSAHVVVRLGYVLASCMMRMRLVDMWKFINSCLCISGRRIPKWSTWFIRTPVQGSSSGGGPHSPCSGPLVAPTSLDGNYLLPLYLVNTTLEWHTAWLPLCCM